jgi:hypothetical protein
MFSFKRIYADAAAATPLSPRARKELVRLLDWYGNAGAIHTEGIEAKKELEEARARIAKSSMLIPMKLYLPHQVQKPIILRFTERSGYCCASMLNCMLLRSLLSISRY